MNYRTTIVLLLILGLGVAGYFFCPGLRPAHSQAEQARRSDDQGSLRVLADDLITDKLSRIAIKSATNQVVLERSPGGEWSLPGQWPAAQTGNGRAGQHADALALPLRSRAAR